MGPAATSLAEVVHPAPGGEPTQVVATTVRSELADTAELHLGGTGGAAALLAGDHGRRLIFCILYSFARACVCVCMYG